MKRILFQGDSITDAGRNKDEDRYAGHGYATLVSAELGFDRSGEFEFINRGIGGNRSIDILARVKKDTINLEPDYMSILMGVNDVWHEVYSKNGVDIKRFELYYNIMIEQIKEALPNIKIMLLEPFVLKGSATDERWTEFRIGVEQYAEVTKRVAEKYNLPFVPLMKLFDDAQKLAPAEYWLLDGVHPTAHGHELIKREWIKTFIKMEK